MRRIAIACLVAVALAACDGAHTTPVADAACSDAWLAWVEQQVPTGDGAGHGPDVGTEEWKSVVEFRLGIRGAEGVPPRDSDDWCRHVDPLVRAYTPPAPADSDATARSDTAVPSIACDAVPPGSVEEAICGDPELSALDGKLADVYAAALARAADDHPVRLQAEQRGWIEGRDACGKSDDARACVQTEYRRRIAELQARHRLVRATGPVFFACDDNPADEVVVTYFDTDPPTLIAEHGDRRWLMYQRPSGSGTRYQGRNELFWEARGEAAVRFGYDAPEMRCAKAR